MTDKPTSKERWEIFQIIIQAIALIVGGIWAYARWGFQDKAQLMPSFVESIGTIGSYWLIEGRSDICLFHTDWTLENKGSTPINVEDIKVRVYQLPDIAELPSSSDYMNMSPNSRIKNKEPLINEFLTSQNDIVASNAKMSRSISFAFSSPSGEKDWFKNNRIALKVSANVYKEGYADKTYPSTITAARYVCHTPQIAKKKWHSLGRITELQGSEKGLSFYVENSENNKNNRCKVQYTIKESHTNYAAISSLLIKSYTDGEKIKIKTGSDLNSCEKEITAFATE